VSAVDPLALTQVTYNLFDTAHTWDYLLQGHFDLCDGVVSLSLSDNLTGVQAP